jgi:hypothetical protein
MTGPLTLNYIIWIKHIQLISCCFVYNFIVLCVASDNSKKFYVCSFHHLSLFFKCPCFRAACQCCENHILKEYNLCLFPCLFIHFCSCRTTHVITCPQFYFCSCRTTHVITCPQFHFAKTEISCLKQLKWFIYLIGSSYKTFLILQDVSLRKPLPYFIYWYCYCILFVCSSL